MKKAVPGKCRVDRLGFRNRGVPARADIVVIGDSQSLGWGVPLEKNFPQVISHITGLSVYSLAMAGYGSVHYYHLSLKKTGVQP